MASCYGSSGATGDGNASVFGKCPYLPIVKSVQLGKEIIELQLTTFQTERDYSQGFDLMNQVIEEGKTWPFLNRFETMESYKGYFHSHASFCVKYKDEVKYGDVVLGCFYVKPNYPGRCSHICNGGFITNQNFRGMRVGYFMGENFAKLAKDLGYRGSLFNLVFASNTPSVKLWKSLNFKHIGTVPKCAVLVGQEEYVDALQFYKDFYEVEDVK